MSNDLTLSNGMTVSKQHYVTAKTKDLKEFGYESLTEAEVEDQVDKILNGEDLGVIGLFCKDDIQISPKANNHE